MACLSRGRAGCWQPLAPHPRLRMGRDWFAAGAFCSRATCSQKHMHPRNPRGTLAEPSSPGTLAAHSTLAEPSQNRIPGTLVEPSPSRNRRGTVAEPSLEPPRKLTTPNQFGLRPHRFQLLRDKENMLRPASYGLCCAQGVLDLENVATFFLRRCHPVSPRKICLLEQGIPKRSIGGGEGGIPPTNGRITLVEEETKLFSRLCSEAPCKQPPPPPPVILLQYTPRRVFFEAPGAIPDLKIMS